MSLDGSAQTAGGFYSDREFDLGPMLGLPSKRLNVSRACIGTHYRQEAAVAALRVGLAEIVKDCQISMLFDCASIEMKDGEVMAQATMNQVQAQTMTHPGYRVTPKDPLPPLLSGAPTAVAALPAPLLKSYARLGARACSEPCYDSCLICADIVVLAKVHEIDASYTKHFRDRALHG